MVWGFFVVFMKPRVYLQESAVSFYCTNNCWDELTQNLIEKKLVEVLKLWWGT